MAFRFGPTTVLGELRATRQRRRLGDTEWFEVAYRVYLFGLLGLIATVVVSDWIDGLVGEDVTTADIVGRWPSIAGIAVAVAFALGVRSGADGGPIAIEVADIRHVLLAPISRTAVLRRPIVQRMRATMFAVALPTAVVGQLVAREVAGSRAAWAGAGVLFGCLLGAVFVSVAVVAHALRMARPLATLLATVALSWQGAAAWNTWQAGDRSSAARWPSAGPFDTAGSVALWGIRQRRTDIVALVTVAALVVAALALGGRLRIEPLVRRGRLVSQLRFAATVQDVRTVVLLRRQLRAETPRRRPWFESASPPERPTPSQMTPSQVALRRAEAGTPRHPSLVWRRGVRSLRRLPLSRLGRLASLAVAAGVAASLAVTASPIFYVGVLAALFLAGVESVEPLSQEVDRPGLTDGFPTLRGWLFAHHLVASAMLLTGVGIVGAATASVIEPSHTAAAFAVAIPAAWGGGVGAVVGAVLDAAPPAGAAARALTGRERSDENASLVPIEFAGASQAFSTFLPVVLSGLGVAPIAAIAAAPNAGTATRLVVGLVLVIASLVVWVQRRDRWAAKIRAFFEAGRAERTGATT